LTDNRRSVVAMPRSGHPQRSRRSVAVATPPPQPRMRAAPTHSDTVSPGTAGAVACATRRSARRRAKDAATSAASRAAAGTFGGPQGGVEGRAGGASPSAASAQSATGTAAILAPVAAHAAAGGGSGPRRPLSVGARGAGTPHATVNPSRFTPPTTAVGCGGHPAPPLPPPDGSNTLDGAPSPPLVATAAAATPARPSPPRSPPPPGGSASPDRPSRPLVVAPAVHLHGGLRGEVMAVLSAGFEAFRDGAHWVTECNMVSRLFLDNTNVGRRLIRLGCLPGCADAETTADGTPVARVVPLPSGSPPRRAPV